MKRSSLIGHAVQLLDTIRSNAQPADGIVKDFYRARHYLGSKDRRFITDATFGILRNYRFLEFCVREALSVIGPQPPPPSIPSVTLYTVYALRISGENTESLPTDLAGIWERQVQDITCTQFLENVRTVDVSAALQHDVVRRMAVQYSFPDAIVGEWVDRFGVDGTGQLCAALNQPAPVTIRVNTLKVTVPECEAALRNEGVRCRRTGLSPFGLVLEKRINVHTLATFRNGYFELQDEGSQLLPLVLNPSPGDCVVDACAGSGGKTLELAALMNDNGRILSIDVDEARLRANRQRVQRAGISIVQGWLARHGTAGLEAWRGKADAVLIDAPCSGVGVFRRNPWAKLRFTEDFVAQVSLTQRSLLESNCQLVKPGGKLVYATCSLLREENEAGVEWFLRRHEEFSLRPASETLSSRSIDINASSPYLTLLPHETSTDGFFAALMQRMH
jgi:16S rRNA (cytosine967-C5)-methyltransferase